jgi:hypothetical protein
LAASSEIVQHSFADSPALIVAGVEVKLKILISFFVTVTVTRRWSMAAPSPKAVSSKVSSAVRPST